MSTTTPKKIEMLVRALADAHDRASSLMDGDESFSQVEALVHEALQQAIDLKRKASTQRMLEIASRHNIDTTAQEARS